MACDFALAHQSDKKFDDSDSGNADDDRSLGPFHINSARKRKKVVG